MKDYLYTTIIYIATAYKVVWKSPRYAKKTLNELNQILGKKEYSLDKSLAARIKIYIAIGNLTSSWFCALRGYKASRTENINTLYLAAIMPMLDDLTDSLQVDSTDIIRDIENNEDSLHPTMPAIRHLYYKLIENCSDLFIETFHNALKVQDNSIIQLGVQKLKKEDLESITYEKGGISVFLFRLVLDHTVLDNEEKSIYELGYVIQLVNDAFDIYKDYKNQQQTLFTNSTDMRANMLAFTETLDKTKRGFLSLGYANADTKNSLCQISIITSMAQVCLDQLVQCQAATDGFFHIEQYERKQLICDMSKWPNMIKTFRYSVSYSKNLGL